MRKFAAIWLTIAVMALGALLLCGCSLIPEVQAKEVTDFAQASFSYKPGSNSWDATDFLVGEFYVNSGELARFDGRGTVTVIRPDGVSVSGLYAMTESSGKEAVVTMLLDGVEKSYDYDLISKKGDFTLTSGSSMLVYSPVEYQN